MLSSNSLNLWSSLESKVLPLGKAPSFHSTLTIAIMERANNDHLCPQLQFLKFYHQVLSRTKRIYC